MEEFLDQIWFGNQVADYAKFLAVAASTLILSRWIGRILGYLVYRLFRKLSKENRVVDFNRLLARPLGFWIVLITIYFAFNFLKTPQELDVAIYGASLTDILLNLYRTCMAIVFGWVLLRAIDFTAKVLDERAKVTESKTDDQVILFVKDIGKVLVVFLIIFFVLGGIFGINITSLLAGAGIAGLAIALAAKESLENLFGSFTIFVEKPFTIGDFVQVGDVIGTVEKVGFRSTRIRTLEKTFVTLPNRKIIDSHAENLTLRTFRRVSMTIGVTYDTSIDQLQAIVADIQKFIDEHELTNQDGIIGFHEFGDSSLNILVQYYVQNMDWQTYVKTREEINFEIMRIVERHKTGFAFPTRTIHIEQS